MRPAIRPGPYSPGAPTYTGRYGNGTSGVNITFKTSAGPSDCTCSRSEG